MFYSIFLAVKMFNPFKKGGMFEMKPTTLIALIGGLIAILICWYGWSSYTSLKDGYAALSATNKELSVNLANAQSELNKKTASTVVTDKAITDINTDRKESQAKVKDTKEALEQKVIEVKKNTQNKSGTEVDEMVSVVRLQALWDVYCTNNKTKECIK